MEMQRVTTTADKRWEELTELQKDYVEGRITIAAFIEYRREINLRYPQQETTI